MTHIYPISLTGSHKSQSVKSISLLGTYCTNGALKMSLQGRTTV